MGTGTDFKDRDITIGFLHVHTLPLQSFYPLIDVYKVYREV